MTPAERRLVADHLDLAELAAGKANSGTPSVWHGDLHSAALEGLIAAAVTYKPDGTDFVTWARFTIRHAIADERQKLLTGRKRSTRRLDPDIDPGRSNDRTRDQSLSSQRTRDHTDKRTGADHDRNPLLEDHGSDPADIYADGAHAADDAIAVQAALAGLNPTDRALLRRYYYDRMTLAAIGRADGVTESAISQRLKRVRATLRAARRSDPNPDNH